MHTIKILTKVKLKHISPDKLKNVKSEDFKMELQAYLNIIKEQTIMVRNVLKNKREIVFNQQKVNMIDSLLDNIICMSESVENMFCGIKEYTTTSREFKESMYSELYNMAVKVFESEILTNQILRGGEKIKLNINLCEIF